MNGTIIGTVLKMAINFSYPADPTLRLDDVLFSVDYYCHPSKKQHFDKEDLIRTTEGSSVQYYAPVDTAMVGIGKLKMVMTVDIPDTDFPQNKRREIVACESNVVIEANPLR